MYAAEIVLKLKKEYPYILLEAAIPCENQSIRWSEKLRKRYYNIVEKCDIKTVVQKEYTIDCMHKRNCYMADKSHWLVAVWDGSSSGTGKTVEYARGKGVGVVCINPILLKIKKL